MLSGRLVRTGVPARFCMVHFKGIRVHLPVFLGKGNASKVQVRPADGARMEALYPARAGERGLYRDHKTFINRKL